MNKKFVYQVGNNKKVIRAFVLPKKPVTGAVYIDVLEEFLTEIFVLISCCYIKT